jgi:hypothetical protein
MIDRDIWLGASALIKLHGDDAKAHAVVRADALQQQGDKKGYAVWKRIAAAINELTSVEYSGTIH